MGDVVSEITLHTGEMGDETTVHIEWFDHNGVKKHNELVIRIEPYDKPRTLSIVVDKAVVFQNES